MSTATLCTGTSQTASEPRLLDLLCQAARERGHSEQTVNSFCTWSRRFVLFHGKRHPRDLRRPEIVRFLESLARLQGQLMPAS
jgi:hypothetical protein